MPEFDEHRFRADVKTPSLEQVERAAKLICLAYDEPLENWHNYTRPAMGTLIILMNQSKVRFRDY